MHPVLLKSTLFSKFKRVAVHGLGAMAQANSPDDRSELDSLRALARHDELSLPPVTYRGYTLERVSPDSDEFFLLNRTGNHVETLSPYAFDSAEAFVRRVDEIIDYNPASMQAWLDRDRAGDGDE